MRKGLVNYWKGQGDELSALRKELDATVEMHEAEAFAEQVRFFQHDLTRRDELQPKLSELETKLAALGETTRDYFKKAQAIMHWSGYGVRRDTVTGEEFIEPCSPNSRRGAMGKLIDEPPLDREGRPVVPADAWEAVKRYRELFIERVHIGSQLDGVNRVMRDAIAKTPALAYVKPTAAAAEGRG